VVITNETWIYHSENTVKASGDFRNLYWEGLIVRLVQNNNEKFFRITGVTYSNGYTYLSLNGGGLYTLGTEPITEHQHSPYLAPRGFPIGFDLLPQYLAESDHASTSLHTPGSVVPVTQSIPSSGGSDQIPSAAAVRDAIDARAPDLDTNAAVRFNSTTHKYEATSTCLFGNIGTSGDCALELGALSSGDRHCYIDFHARDSPSDYTFRIIQYSDASRVFFYNSLDGKFVFMGNIGIGMANPTYGLQLTNDSAAKPSTNTWTVSSDRRLKENIIDADLDRCLEIVKQLPLRRFTWRDEYIPEDAARDRSKLGWIADEVEPVFPKAVQTAPFVRNKIVKKMQTDENGNEYEVEETVSETVFEDCKYLDSDQVIAALYGAVQKLIQIVEQQQVEIEKLKSLSA
jgi:hypothetical protein